MQFNPSLLNTIIEVVLLPGTSRQRDFVNSQWDAWEVGVGGPL